MREGKLVRVEELTRIPADVQDAFITILSEKTLPIPELNIEVSAAKGFNVIATANNRDSGVNDPVRRAVSCEHSRNSNRMLCSLKVRLMLKICCLSIGHYYIGDSWWYSMKSNAQEADISEICFERV